MRICPLPNTYAACLWAALAFLAQSPEARRQLLPDRWPQPRELDNGYAFVAEQPAHAMQDFCESWLRLPELWTDDPEFTALGLATADVQQQTVQHVSALKTEAQTQNWQRWRNNANTCEEARAVLQVMQWPADITGTELCAALDSETYGTFSAAFGTGG